MISFQRFYHVSSVTCSIKKQGIKLCKMVNPRVKKQWYPTLKSDIESLPTIKTLTKIEREPGKRGLRRTAMLNKMFMKQITDLMSTGTVAMDVVGRGIEISKVSVTTDFQTVNVFWVCKGNSSDEETEQVLNKVAGALRHELSTLRVMGEIPYVVFVKDKQEARLVDLDKRLAIADYGEDYTPTDLGHLLKSEFVLNTRLSPEVMAKIKSLEDEIPFVEEPIPQMTHNVFGLEHDKIMNRLLAARKKTRDAWSTLDINENPDVISYRAPVNKVAEPVVSNQRKELADFLLKRQIMHKKILKRLNSSQNDWQQGDPPEDDEQYEDDDYYHDDDEADFDDTHTKTENNNSQDKVSLS